MIQHWHGEQQQRKSDCIIQFSVLSFIGSVPSPIFVIHIFLNPYQFSHTSILITIFTLFVFHLFYFCSRYNGNAVHSTSSILVTLLSQSSRKHHYAALFAYSQFSSDYLKRSIHILYAKLTKRVLKSNTWNMHKNTITRKGGRGNADIVDGEIGVRKSVRANHLCVLCRCIVIRHIVTFYAATFHSEKQKYIMTTKMTPTKQWWKFNGLKGFHWAQTQL